MVLLSVRLARSLSVVEGRPLSIVKGSIILSIFLYMSCSSVPTIEEQPKEIIDLEIPSVQREFRAAWVATVSNINWPSRPGLSAQEQKREAIFLLDFLKEHNFNAVIFQIRPQCDALYQSTIEPWSYFLTGIQGKPPDPFYDPLQFWVEEAHKRGLELHAWFNPYRAHHTSGGRIQNTSIVKKNPTLVVGLKDGHFWLDPGLKETQDYTHSVIVDVLRRYDVDGIHLDDYFYPYPSYNDNKDFPDTKSWKLYKKRGGTLARSDWRRNNVNVFLERLYKSIKKEKPFVKFGISPFGIWRPKYPESIEGFDQYEKLYADARLWLNEGWLDYWVPQLYWPIEQMPQSYPVLLGWWALENHKNRHFWPGINVSRFKGEKGSEETISQVLITQLMLPNDAGNIHWSIGSLVENKGLMEQLKKHPYKNQAIVPASLWLNTEVPKPPKLNLVNQGWDFLLEWSNESPKEVFRWVVYTKYGETWDYTVYNQDELKCKLPKFGNNVDAKNEPLKQIAVSAVNRSGNESTKTILDVFP